MNSENVILIGMPGCGKSTCGIISAKLLLKNFFDTDLLIQSIEGQRLQTIIDTKGNDDFEHIEEEAILSLDIKGTVIATGGSVIYSDKSMKHLKSMGKVVFLDIDYEHMCKRINNLSTRGIVMRHGGSLLDMYNERLPLYKKWADITIDCNDTTAEQAANAIFNAIENNT